MAALTACGLSTTNAAPSVTSLPLEGKTVVLFGDQQFIQNSTTTLEQLGATIVTAADYQSAQVGIDQPVEIHCIQPGQTNEIVMQANHISNLNLFECEKGAIFINFRTITDPDVIAD